MQGCLTILLMANEQYGNVGDLGGILKHGALVKLAAMMGNQDSGPVSYFETNTPPPITATAK